MKRALIAFLAVMMIAGGAFAQGGGGGRGGHGPGGDDGGPGANLIVTDNGTVFIVNTARDSATDTSTTTIKAISTSGATLWTATLSSGRGHLFLSGGNLLSVTDSSTTTAVQSTITAIATATGATAWTLNVAGRVQGLEAFSGGTYAVVVVPPAAEGGAATRSLVAISNSGTILWSVAL